MTTNRLRSRAGIAMVECAFALSMLFLLLFAMLDLGLAAARYNAISEAARRIAREAIIHGSLAAHLSTTWGPQEYEGTAADSSEIALIARPVLLAMPHEDVTIQLKWIDDDNSPRDRVRVEVGFVHKPIVPSLFAWGPLNLRAISTMRIVN